MIIKGSSHTGRGLGAYLQSEKNERIEIWGIRGDIERDLSETLKDWRSDALGTRCGNPLYHAQLSPDRVLSPEEWQTAIKIYEKKMGFENQPRASVLHELKGREHLHLVYSRMDEQGHAISDSWNYLHHERAAREIERELGMKKTQGVFIGREGDRPERTLSHAEIQQGERLKYNPKEIKAEISALYQSAAKDGAVFIASLHNKGYTLAKGDSHAYVIIDEKGGVHRLSRTAGVKVTELRETLSEYALKDLPEAKEIQRERREQNHTAELTNKPQLTLEQQKANNELQQRQAEALANEKRWQNYQQELRDQKERWNRGEEIELDYGLGLDLSRY